MGLFAVDRGAWIGLNDLQDQMSFEWADGSPVLVTFWQHSEPNNYLGKREDCVEAISYKEVCDSLTFAVLSITAIVYYIVTFSAYSIILIWLNRQK